MEETKEKTIPETTVPHAAYEDNGFAKIEMLLNATGGLSLSQVCAVIGLESSTIQNWVKRGWVAHPNGKKYEEKHIARILIINALKECVKLEYIAQLMEYVNGNQEDDSEHIIKESQLYDYLCNALEQLGQADDLSRNGVESVANIVIKNYKGPTPQARVKIRKALAVMIYACVCTDVKRRTESMMKQILHELENPHSVTEEANDTWSEDQTDDADDAANTDSPGTTTQASEVVEETRKTVAQALREWDLARVEDILNEESEEDEKSPAVDEVFENVGPVIEQQPAAAEEKTAQKPWYFRRN